MPNFGVGELLLILLIIVLVFGAGKLPQVAKDLGKATREFRKAARGDDDEPAKPEEKATEITAANKKT